MGAQIGGGTQNVFNIGAEIGVGEIAGAFAQTGKIKPHHPEPDAYQSLCDCPHRF